MMIGRESFTSVSRSKYLPEFGSWVVVAWGRGKGGPAEMKIIIIVIMIIGLNRAQEKAKNMQRKT